MEFLHPHVSSKIVDNSILFLSAQGLTNLFAVMTSEKGEDNVTTYQSSPTEYLFNYGEPDMAKHGQMGYNVYEWLKTGGAAYVLRVLPTDAVFANAVLEARVKDDTATTDQVLVKTALTTTDTATTANSLTTYLEDNVAADADGYDVYRLMAIRPKARGGWYNNLGFQLEVNDNFDNTYDFRVFDFTVIEQVEGGGTVAVEGPFQVAMAPDALSINRESLYIVDVLAKYSKYFEVEVNQDAMDAFASAMDGYLTTSWGGAYNGTFGAVNPDLIDWASGTMTTDSTVDALWPVNEVVAIEAANVEVNDTFTVTIDALAPQTFIATAATAANVAGGLQALLDVLDGVTARVIGDICYVSYTDPTVTTAPTVVVAAADGGAGADTQNLTATTLGTAVKWINSTDAEATSVDFADFTDIQMLASGDDSLTYDVNDIDEVKQLIVDGYMGITDPQITNRKAMPIDMLIDGNYDDDIKDKIADFAAEIRRDCMAILDTGFTASAQGALNWRDANQVSSFFVAIFTQDFIVYDNFSGRDIKVTSPYFLSSKIPLIDAEFGLQWPFVGPRRGTVSGYKKMSWNPTDAEKEALYKKQVNYVEKDTKRTSFATQTTSQTQVSALSNIHSVRALLRIRREVEELAEDYKMEFGDDTTYQSLQYNLNNYLQKWIDNRACQKISGTVYASDYDKQQKIARIRIEMQFTNVIERILIDLVVNR